MTMSPRVVKADAAPFWARSAEIFVPPVAAVMLTAACTPVPSKIGQRARRRIMDLAFRQALLRCDWVRRERAELPLRCRTVVWAALSGFDLMCQGLQT